MGPAFHIEFICLVIGGGMCSCNDLGGGVGEIEGGVAVVKGFDFMVCFEELFRKVADGEGVGSFVVNVC